MQVATEFAFLIQLLWLPTQKVVTPQDFQDTPGQFKVFLALFFSTGLFVPGKEKTELTYLIFWKNPAHYPISTLIL
jgi:hypothetical protein